MTGLLLKLFNKSFNSYFISKNLNYQINKNIILNKVSSLSFINNKIKSPSLLILIKNNNYTYVNQSNVMFYSCKFYSTKNESEGTFTSLKNNSTKPGGSKFKKYAIYALCIVYGTFFASILYNAGLPSIDEEGNEIRDEFSDLPSLEQFFKRMFDRLYVFKEFIRRPSSDKLLPNPAPIGQPKYTLVLELTHVLLHPDWTYQTGWRFKKRPNVDHFLEQLASPMYEIVLFTTQIGMNMSPIVEVLNKSNAIKYTLYRDATDFINGEHVKNLNCLNRDLSKVIVIDWNPNALQLHSENALILPKWNGNDDDNTLVELVAFLKNIAEKSPDDVRDVLSYYKQFSDPMENFRETQRKLPNSNEVPSA